MMIACVLLCWNQFCPIISLLIAVTLYLGRLWTNFEDFLSSGRLFWNCLGFTLLWFSYLLMLCKCVLSVIPRRPCCRKSPVGLLSLYFLGGFRKLSCLNSASYFSSQICLDSHFFKDLDSSSVTSSYHRFFNSARV